MALAASASPRSRRSNWCGLFLSEVRIYTALPFLPILRGVSLLTVAAFGLAHGLPWQAIPRGLYKAWEQLKRNLRIMALMPEGPGAEAINVNGAGSRRRLLIDRESFDAGSIGTQGSEQPERAAMSRAAVAHQRKKLSKFQF